MTNSAFDELFGGPPRKPESPITQREMDLARSIQVITEEVMLKMAQLRSQRNGDEETLHGRRRGAELRGQWTVLREVPFEDIWIQPAAGDAGGALGIALAIWHRYLGKQRSSPEEARHVAIRSRKPRSMQRNGLPRLCRRDEGLLSWAARHTDEEIEEFLEYAKSALQKIFARRIAGSGCRACWPREKSSGLHQGRMEFGPRALGGRSIIGDPRSPEMQSVMNLKIKYRESFRPFAPSVLREQVSDWFELDTDSPYMLLVADVAESKRRPMTDEEKALWGIEKLNVKRSRIPAVTHVDYSARIQTVPRNESALLGNHRGLSKTDRLSGDRQHQFQRARRTDRLHARRQLSLFHENRNGFSGAGNLRAQQGEPTSVRRQNQLAVTIHARLRKDRQVRRSTVT